jgi:hypothetical protein
VSALFTPKGKTDYALGYVTMNAKNAAQDSSGYVYNAYADNSGSTSNVLANGKRNTVYASAMYHMDKATDFYVVMDKLSLENHKILTIHSSPLATLMIVTLSALTPTLFLSLMCFYPPTSVLGSSLSINRRLSGTPSPKAPISLFPNSDPTYVLT